MTQVHFTLKQKDIQRLIQKSVKDDLSKNILTKVFNELMKEAILAIASVMVITKEIISLGLAPWNFRFQEQETGSFLPLFLSDINATKRHY